MTEEDNTPAVFESLGRRVGKTSPKSITIGEPHGTWLAERRNRFKNDGYNEFGEKE